MSFADEANNPDQAYQENQQAVNQKYGLHGAQKKPAALGLADALAAEANHRAQGHEGDSQTCADCGFKMQDTAIEPSMQNLTQGLLGK